MRRASPTLIGAFVVGAISLLVIGLVVFGAGRFFTDRVAWVTYFPGSVQGLRVGAPVNFRGATVGEVTRIQVLYDDEDGSLIIPVVVEIDPGQVTVIDQVGAERTDQTEMEDLIARGLRAQLQVESLITGLLSVELDFYPDMPMDLVEVQGTEFSQYPELPAIPSRMEELEQSLSVVMQEIPGLLREVRALLSEVTAGNTAENVDRILADVAEFTDSLDRAAPAIERMVAQTLRAVDSVESAADTAEEILVRNHDAIDAMIADLRATIVAVRRMADQVNNLIAENRQGLSDFTQTGLYELTGLVQDAQRMVNQITRVAEQLERDPARFLFGDRGQGVRAP